MGGLGQRRPGFRVWYQYNVQAVSPDHVISYIAAVLCYVLPGPAAMLVRGTHSLCSTFTHGETREAWQREVPRAHITPMATSTGFLPEEWWIEFTVRLTTLPSAFMR
jgi:hypothetical protein